MILTRLLAALTRRAPATGEQSVEQTLSGVRVLIRERRFAEAEALLRGALMEQPDRAELSLQLGLLLTALGRAQDALDELCRWPVEALTPDALEARVRLLLALGRVDAACGDAAGATQVRPELQVSWLCEVLASEAAGDYEASLHACERAEAVGGASAEITTRRGIALQHLGRYDAAFSTFNHVLQAEGDYRLARFHRGLVRLGAGDYGGWSDYAARTLCGPAHRRWSEYPHWGGPGADGERVVVYGEQGLGDEIMFASCIPDVLKTGIECVIDCRPQLQGLFAQSFPAALVISTEGGDDPGEARADCAIPIGSLPAIFRSQETAFAPHTGYLEPSPEKLQRWRARLDALGPGLKIGLSWKGGTQGTRAHLRSMALRDWAPIWRRPDIQWVSLQYTADAAAEVGSVAGDSGVSIAHWPEAVADYAETAAVVSALDLTVSVCTSVIHLAGALGRRVWVLAPKHPEWRYGRSGTAMAWYPSARLFRQREAGDWSGVIEEVSAALDHLPAGEGAESAVVHSNVKPSATPS